MKSIKTIYTFVAMLIGFSSTSQTFNQTKLVSSSGNDQIIRIKKFDNHLYVFGYFHQNLKIDSAGVELTYAGNGGRDIFIGKFDTTFKPIWINVIGSTLDEGGNYQFGSIEIDNSGNLYVVGSIQNNCVFKSQTIPDTSINNIGATDGFIAKYTNDGNIVWVNTQAGSEIDETHDVAVDNLGNIYIVGLHRTITTFNGKNGTSLTRNATSGSDGFIAKYNANGSLLVVKSYGGGRDDAFMVVKTSNSGNVYIAGGACCGNYSFTIDSNTVDNLNGWGSFWGKFDNNLTAIWMNNLGTTNNEHITSIALSDLGDLYISGHFVNSTIFPSQPGGTSQTLNAIGNYDIMLAQYDTNGIRKNVKRFGSSGIDYSSHVHVGTDNNIYFTGSFSNVITFDSISLTSYGDESIFITKLNNNIECQFALRAGSSTQDYGRDIIFDGRNTVYTVGSTGQPAQFGANNYSGGGGTEGFLTQISIPSLTTSINQLILDQGDLVLNLYPNPSTGRINLKIDGNTSGHITVFDLLGRTILTSEIITDSLYIENYGTYFVKVTTGDYSITKKVVISK